MRPWTMTACKRQDDTVYSSTLLLAPLTVLQQTERGYARRLLILVDVDFGLGPLPSRDPSLEQDVDFSVRSSLHFGEVEVGSDKANECSAGPNVATSSSD